MSWNMQNYIFIILQANKKKVPFFIKSGSKKTQDHIMLNSVIKFA